MDDTWDARRTYPYACPKCDVVNATRTATESEEDWVMTCWTCDNCGYEWREHFEFSYWDQE